MIMRFSGGFFALAGACVAWIPLFAPVYAQTLTGSSCPQFPQSGVSVVLSSELSTTAPDVPVGITASIDNTGTTAVNDGVLFVRVTDPSGGIVNQFVPLRGVDLGAGATTSASFVWQVPLVALSGTYHVSAIFVSPQNAFVPPPSLQAPAAGSLAMPVAGGQSGAVQFDLAGVMLQGASYDAGLSTAFFSEANSSVVVSVNVDNNTDIPYKGFVAWSLFNNGYSPLAEEPTGATTTVELHPHTSKSVTFSVPVSADHTEYLEGDLGGGASSVIGIYLVDGNTCSPAALSSTPNNEETWLLTIAAAVIIAGGVVWQLRTNKHIFKYEV